MIKNEILSARIKLEGDIRAAIQKALDEFTDKTGLYPYSIDVDMICNFPFGAKQKEYLLGSVTIRVEL